MAGLQIQGVSKRFGDVQALSEVDLSVGPGELVGFLGPNGAGKTTAMRVVMGLVAADAGRVLWDGAPVTDAARRRFGYMPAERGMYPKMRVRDQLLYFARLAGSTAADAAASADRWMDRLGIAQRARDDVQALSSGNQQRVQLAISLVHSPALLVLDEPFSGLDPIAVETMKEIIDEQRAEGVAVLFSSHQLDLVSDICRRVVVIDGGRIVLAGDVDDLREGSPDRDVLIRFAEPCGWSPAASIDGIVAVAQHGDREVRLRVLSSVSPDRLVADAATAGRVVQLSFRPPDLSDVFLAAVRHADDRAVPS